MSDPWDMWDERVKATGRPDRLAAEMHHHELLALLASERAARRPHEKELVKQELLVRLERGHRSLGGVEPTFQGSR